MEIFYTAQFARLYKKIPDEIKRKAEKRETLFRENPFAPSLKTHKLQGDLSDFWSFTIDFRNRIIFEFKDDRTAVIFHSIGDHDMYR